MKKKIFIGIVVVLVAAIAALCTLDIGTGLIVEKGSEYVAENYKVDLTFGGAKGNPFKGYTFTDIDLAREGESLFKAEKIYVDPALLKIIMGNIALDWVQLDNINTTIPHLLQLAEIFTGEKVELPASLPLKDLVLNSVGGAFDGSEAAASLDIALNGLPMVGDFTVGLSNGITIKKGSLKIAGGDVNVTGDVMPTLDIKASVSQVQISELGAVVPQIGDVGAKGLLNLEATAKGELENPTVDAKVSLDDGAAAGLPVSVSTSVAMEDKKVNLDPLNANMLGIPVNGNVFADISGETPSIKVQMATDGAVTAETLSKNLPELPVAIGGQVDGINVSVEGPVTALNGNAELKAAKLTIADQSITDTLFKADFSQDGKIKVSGGTNIAGNPATLAGTLDLGGAETAADIAFSLKNFDLAMLPKIIADAPENIKGKVSAAVTVKGKGDGIVIGGKLESDRVSLNDMNVDKINVPVSYKNGAVTFENASLVFMDLPITNVTGSITPGGDNVAFKEMSATVAGGTVKIDSVLLFGTNLNGNYDANISNIDLGNVLKTFGAGSLGAAGKFNANVKGEISDTDITGKGSVSIPSFTIMGLKFEQIKSSVEMSKMVASMPDFGCNFADGTIGGDATVDINAMTYALKINVNNSQLKAIMEQAMPTLGGGLTGTLTGDYSASGKLNPLSLDGSGSISSAGGQLFGFSGFKTIIEMLTKVYGAKNGVSYANAKIPFTTSIDKLTLKDAVINANEGDGMYQSFNADGTFAFTGDLDINVSGKLNSSLVNTAASALNGNVALTGVTTLLGAGVGTVTGVVSGVAGIIPGGKKIVKPITNTTGGFRTLSFKVSGTTDKVKFTDIKIDGKESDSKSADTSSGTSKSSSKSSSKSLLKKKK